MVLVGHRPIGIILRHILLLLHLGFIFLLCLNFLVADSIDVCGLVVEGVGLAGVGYVHRSVLFQRFLRNSKHFQIDLGAQVGEAQLQHLEEKFFISRICLQSDIGLVRKVEQYL